MLLGLYFAWYDYLSEVVAITVTAHERIRRLHAARQP
jgi:hypothetical protein